MVSLAASIETNITDLSFYVNAGSSSLHLPGLSIQDPDTVAITVTLSTDIGHFSYVKSGMGVVASSIDPMTVSLVGKPADITAYLQDTNGLLSLDVSGLTLGNNQGHLTISVKDEDPAVDDSVLVNIDLVTGTGDRTYPSDLIVTTGDSETYDNGDEAAERADGAGLSFEEALGLAEVGDQIATDPDLVGNLNFTNASFIEQSIVFKSAGTHTFSNSGDISFTGITGGSFTGAVASLYADLTVDNSGSISGNVDPFDLDFVPLFRVGSGVFMVNGSLDLTNDVSGEISGDRFGVYIVGDEHNASHTIENSGLIQGGEDGMQWNGGTLINRGTIQSTNEVGYFNTIPDGPNDGVSTWVSGGTLVPVDFDPLVGLSHITNEVTGVITGGRAATIQNGGGFLDNAGSLIGGKVGAVGDGVHHSVVDVDPYSVVWTIENSGLIKATGEGVADGYGDVISAVYSDGQLAYTVLNNSGDIESSAFGVYSIHSLRLTNDATGRIVSDTDNMGDEAAILTAQAEDYFILPSIKFYATNHGTYDEALPQQPAGFDLEEMQFLEFSNFKIFSLDTNREVGYTPAKYESDGNGSWQLVLDANGRVEYHDIVTSDGVYEVFFNEERGQYDLLDPITQEGLPVSVDPFASVNDTISNSGLIDGDIFLGIGADCVTNTGTIDGMVDLGIGDDCFDSATGTLTGVIMAGAGNDTITGTAGDDTINGGEGDDTFILKGSFGADLIVEADGEGSDVLYLPDTAIASPADYFSYEIADNGRDILVTMGTDGTVTLQDGALLATSVEIIRYHDQNTDQQEIDLSAIIEDLVAPPSPPSRPENTPTNQLPPEDTTPSDGDDDLQLGSNNDVLALGDGDDTIHAGNGDDAVWAGAADKGDDVIDGGNGHDTLAGGAGSDMIIGGTGSDLLFGGAGNDQLFAAGSSSGGGEIDDNTMWGGSGNDTATGSFGDDVIGGGEGDDHLMGDRGDDIFYGGRDDGNDTIDAGNGNDRAFGGGGDDLIDGGNGNDALYNGGGSDTVLGGNGNDILWAGSGDDVLTGGAGLDTFAFTQSGGKDSIEDYSLTEDILNLSRTGFGTVAEAKAAFISVDGGISLIINDTTSVYLKDLSLTDVDSLSIVI